MFVLARTNRDAAPHRGLSMLLVLLEQPGIEIRPIRNITGDTDFNEVFFDLLITERLAYPDEGLTFRDLGRAGARRNLPAAPCWACPGSGSSGCSWTGKPLRRRSAT